MKRHPTVIAAFRRLLRIARCWSVDEALWVLQVYRGTREEICWRSFWTTPWEIGIAVEGSKYASEVAVKFLGGPDGTQECIGSLLMFVIDRALNRWQRDGISWSWLLRFNGETETHISEQLKAYAPDCKRQQYLPGFHDTRFGNCEPGWRGDDERVVDYVQIGEDTYPILESGRQGYVMKRCGKKIPIRVSKSSAGSDSGEVPRWSSSGRVGVCGEI